MTNTVEKESHDYSDPMPTVASEEEENLLPVFTVEGFWGERLDKVLASLMPEVSRARLQKLIEDGSVEVNGTVVTKVRQKVTDGDEIALLEEPRIDEALAFAPQEGIDFDVVYEDEAVIVVAKPAGLVVHPGAGNPDRTLLNGLLWRYPELANVPRAGIVHRLDRDTSGLMVVARTLAAQTNLVRQLQEMRRATSPSKSPSDAIPEAARASRAFPGRRACVRSTPRPAPARSTGRKSTAFPSPGSPADSTRVARIRSACI